MPSMFTGIITHIGRIVAVFDSGDRVLAIHADHFTGNLAIGASVACSGVCLTVTEKEGDVFRVQVSQETLSRTTIGDWQENTQMNLERALKVGDELGGHFVSGHVDGLATLKSIEIAGESWKLLFTAPEPLQAFIAPKGSVTLDGVSLTVNEVNGGDFTVNIIPHTLHHTTLGRCKVNDRVNLEIDMIARYLARQL